MNDAYEEQLAELQSVRDGRRRRENLVDVLTVMIVLILGTAGVWLTLGMRP